MMRQIVNMIDNSAEGCRAALQLAGKILAGGRHNRTGMRKGRKAKSRLGAVLSIELVMAMPILLVVLLALVEFGTLLMASQGVNAAAAVGTREASLAGSRDALVQQALANAIDTYPWKTSATTTVFINGQQISLTDGTDNLAAARSGDLISVTVSVPMTAAAPNLLSFVGISLGSNQLTNTYVTRKE